MYTRIYVPSPRSHRFPFHGLDGTGALPCPPSQRGWSLMRDGSCRPFCTAPPVGAEGPEVGGGAGAFGKALLVIGLGLGVLYLGSRAMRSEMASNVPWTARDQARRVFDALSPSERWEIMDEMVLGGDYKSYVIERFGFDERRPPEGFWGALARELELWEQAGE